MSRARMRTARTVASLRQGRNQWYRIENHADASAASIYLYDEIGYWGVTAADFAREVLALQVMSIDLHVNSPGGEVFDGLAIYNTLKSHPASVNVTVDGLAASAASFIAMAGDRITMMRNAQMMIHDASGFCIGNGKDMRELADLLDRLSDNIADIYSQRAGGDVSAWRERMRAETWFSAAEAVTFGLADEVGGSAPEPAADDPANTWDLSIYNFAGREQAPPPLPVVRAQADDPIEPAEELAEPEPQETSEEPTPPADTEPTDDWQQLVSALTTTAPASTVDDVLASLREAL